MIVRAVFLIILASCCSVLVWAHGGRTNEAGCHTNKTTTFYHCHRLSENEAKSASLVFDRSEYGFKSYKVNTNIGYYTQLICSQIHIDHVVSLKDAHISGAAKWSKTKKRAFANDIENHQPVCGKVNISKSDSTPREFLRKSQDAKGLDYELVNFCSYVKQYFYIKSKYDLDTSMNDLRLLNRCL